MALAQVTITAEAGGGQVTVNGADLTRHISAVQMTAEAHKVPQVVLQLHADADVDAVAEVVAVRQGQPDGELIAGFLSAIDPQQLEKDVLEGLGALEGDGENSYTAGLLKRLAAIAKGEW